jgi:hypothetical protein
MTTWKTTSARLSNDFEGSTLYEWGLHPTP